MTNNDWHKEARNKWKYFKVLIFQYSKWSSSLNCFLGQQHLFSGTFPQPSQKSFACTPHRPKYREGASIIGTLEGGCEVTRGHDFDGEVGVTHFWICEVTKNRSNICEVNPSIEWIYTKNLSFCCISDILNWKFSSTIVKYWIPYR